MEYKKDSFSFVVGSWRSTSTSSTRKSWNGTAHPINLSHFRNRYFCIKIAVLRNLALIWLVRVWTMWTRVCRCVCNARARFVCICGVCLNFVAIARILKYDLLL